MGNTRAGSVGAFFSLPFLVAVILLTCAAILAGPVARWLGHRGIKQELPLKARLDLVNVDALGPYTIADSARDRVVHSSTIVEQLGTDQYISWALSDTSVPPSDPCRVARLDVTYYSGGYNLVPHTPDVCLAGSGYQPVKLANSTIQVPALGPEHSSLPVRVCTFVKTSVFNNERVTVIYTFFCNGAFVATRNNVRLRINNPTNVYAFFSKVEVAFPGATREESEERVAKLLGHVLPVLIEDHWPDFAAAEEAARQQDSPQSRAEARDNSAG